MPFCPRCASEYRAGFTRCADCGVDLVENRPEPVPPEDWREVFRGDSAQADIVRGTLEAAGIPTRTPDEYLSSLAIYLPTVPGSFRVLVLAEDLEQARALLRPPSSPPHE